MPGKKIKIIISENRELFRKALGALLRMKEYLEVISEISDGKELLGQLKQKHTDIVLLDAQLTGLEAKEVMKIVFNRFPEVKIIVLGDQASEQSRAEFMALGAGSFLNKTCNEQTLLLAIEKVHSEGFFFDSTTSMALLSKMIHDKQLAAGPHEANFNDRETEIIKRICDGKTNKEIALGLHLSASTIDFYRTRIYSKTKCNNATGLLKYALKNGLIELS